LNYKLYSLNYTGMALHMYFTFPCRYGGYVGRIA
jgi:hypothetical protein